MKRALILIAASAFLSLPALAQDAPASQAPSAAGMALVTDPQQFVDLAGVSNLFEIESSNVALEKAQSEDLRAFAQQMIDDHTAAGERMMTAADEAGVTVPTALDAEHQQKLDQLNEASAEEFDQLYATMQVEAHEQAVMLFEGFAESGEEETLAAFAQETLPTLQEHYDHISSVSVQ